MLNPSSQIFIGQIQNRLFLSRHCGIMDNRWAAARIAPARGREACALELPKRKQIRLPDYDYSTPGAYFVTVCTQDRRCILSSVRRGDPCGRPSVELSAYGTVIEPAMRQTAELYDIQIGHCVVMPNHIHFICVIEEPRAATRAAPTIGQIVGAIKSISANRCREAGLSGKLWQRGYYEHVIRNEKDYLEICAYIENNPARWAEDRYYQA